MPGCLRLAPLNCPTNTQLVAGTTLAGPCPQIILTRVLPTRERIVRQRTAIAPRERIIRERIVREDVTPSTVETVVAPRELVVAPRESGIVTTGFSTEPRRCILDLNGFERCY